MAIVIAATAHSQWQALASWLEPAAGASDDWERGAAWYSQAGTSLPDGARVLILHCRPEYAIAHAMRLGGRPEAALQHWRDTTAAILGFFRRNRRRTTLIEVPSVFRQPGKLAEHLGPHLDQPLQAWEGAFPATENPSLLMQAMAAQMVAQAPELAALMSEAEASTLPQDEKTWQPVPVDIAALAGQLEEEEQERDRQVAAQSKKLESARQEIQVWQQRLLDAEEQANKQLAELAEARDHAKHEAKAREDQLAALREQHKAGERSLAETKEENELLLLQLHQVQEELETTFLKAQQDSDKLRETEQGLETRNAEIATLQQKIQELEKSPFRRTLAPLQALAWPRGKRNAEERKLQRDIALIQSSGFFNAKWYLQTYPDVAQDGVDPLEHYLRHGAAEGRNPSTEFVTEYYLRMNPDVREAAMNPLLHYIKFGREEGRQPKG